MSPKTAALREKYFAFRNPTGDYFFGLENSVRGALERASEDAGFSADKIIGN
jgi:hypothetical protein